MWCQTLGARESIEIVEMDDVPYSRAFAFAVKDFMAAWAPNTSSFLVDSTCEYFKEPLLPLLNILVVNTNKSNMELFGGLADMDGEGLPLSFLFVVTSAEAPPHTKERVFVNWMVALKPLESPQNSPSLIRTRRKSMRSVKSGQLPSTSYAFGMSNKL